jgi:hypothetical protein
MPLTFKHALAMNTPKCLIRAARKCGRWWAEACEGHTINENLELTPADIDYIKRTHPRAWKAMGDDGMAELEQAAMASFKFWHREPRSGRLGRD